MEEPPPPESSFLPIDLVLEIATRSDPITLVRCAATCKALRRHVAALAPAAGRLHLRLRRHAADGRFVPTLLRGFIYQRRDRDEGEHPSLVDPWCQRAPPPEPFRAFFSEYSDLFEFYQPAASRGGLVALRYGSGGPGDAAHGPWPGGAGVCNPMTGLLDLFRSPPGLPAHSYALLTNDCDGIGCRYRLLGANLSSTATGHGGGGCLLRTLAYSSDTCAWGDVTETALPRLPPDAKFVRPCPLILAGVAHWLCNSGHSYFLLAFSDEHSTATVTAIHDDDGDHCPRLHERKPEELLLVSSADGRASLLVAEEQLKLSLWAAPLPDDDPAARCYWTRKAVMVGSGKVRQATPNEVPGMAWTDDDKRFDELRWFGEKSGGVMARMARRACAGSPTTTGLT
ncbi:hypothetical protein QOZ80_5BG0429780 [Eleusine coracana subsp. coracana]|nr:hypothetical protein QOZ80_5BG0429780 [Eleusine coracana subsp. coracana]